jgi:hypothetical protein
MKLVESYLVEALCTELINVVRCETSVEDGWSGSDELREKKQEIESSHIGLYWYKCTK